MSARQWNNDRFTTFAVHWPGRLTPTYVSVTAFLHAWFRSQRSSRRLRFALWKPIDVKWAAVGSNHLPRGSQALSGVRRTQVNPAERRAGLLSGMFEAAGSARRPRW